MFPLGHPLLSQPLVEVSLSPQKAGFDMAFTADTAQFDSVEFTPTPLQANGFSSQAVKDGGPIKASHSPPQ